MKWPTVLAWSLCATALTIAVVGCVLNVMSWDVIRSTGLTPRGFALLLAVAYAVVGAVVASRAPRNAIGWIFALAGVAAAAQYATEQVVYVVSEQSGSPLVAPAALVMLVLGALNSLATAIALLYLFPTGRFLDRRDRVFAIVGIAASVISVGAMLLVVEAIPVPFAGIANPLVRPDAAAFALPVAMSATLAAIASIVMGVRALRRRFSRSTGIERQQLRWFVFVSTLAGVTLVLAYLTMGVFFAVSGEQVLVEPPLAVRVPVWLNILTFVLIAPAIGVAILRHRLYDIDVLIRRTVVYAVTTGAIGLTFFGGIVVLPALLRPLISGSEVAVAVSTLVSFALFQPLRVRVQQAVDRRFYRSRYNAARTLDAFSVRLRDEVDLDAVRADLADAVRDTVQPAHTSIWLRERAR
ncbi:MAG TPA: hypothetical protein VGS01_02445 [Candidatus Limnocylindria bacterium]|jgi:hypothetical protein|nr:hypothetical protein [Candidatus Limnocylindria bacterium]